MRAAAQEQTGGIGVNEVAAAFERLQWGPVINFLHDLGTDLFLQVRDDRRFDLGLVVGAQVKGGPSYFTEPYYDPNGKLAGWWFRDADRRHVDSWLAHRLPHLVILHDPETRTSYWAHITEDAVVATGIGAKIAVPVTNLIDEAHREDLLAVAGAADPGVSWEGSVWPDEVALDPSHRLRYALIVPRLLAPHPNAGRGQPIDAAQALALMMHARFDDIDQFALEHNSVPTLSRAGDSAIWAWRLVGAFAQRTLDGDRAALIETSGQSATPHGQVAAVVLAAIALVEDGLAEAAIPLLSLCIDADRAAPVDHAWLLAQRARALAEVGELEAAREDALHAQAVRLTHRQDVTAGAIAGGAANLLFNTSKWGAQDLTDMIISADNAASWWRTQRASYSLWAIADRTFKRWADDRTVTLGGEDTAHNQMVAASLIASTASDHSAWRQLHSAVGQDALLRLDRKSDPDEVRRALRTLIEAGDHDAVGRAVDRLILDGPARAVRDSLADIDLDRCTRTTGQSALVLLGRGGDVADEVTADRTVDWALQGLISELEFQRRTQPRYDLNDRAFTALAAVAPAASLTRQRLVAEALVDRGPLTDQVVAALWGKVVTSLASPVWDGEIGAAVASAAAEHHVALAIPLLAAASTAHPAAREALLQDARAGSLQAAAALGDVGAYPADLVDQLVPRLDQAVQRIMSTAAAGVHGIGADVMSILVALNAWHPDQAEWDNVVAALGDQAVSIGHKRGAVRRLAQLSDRLSDDVRQRLEEPVGRIADRADGSSVMPFDHPEEAIGEATFLLAKLGALDTKELSRRTIALLSGGDPQRRWAAFIAGIEQLPDRAGVLIALAEDESPRTRAAAAVGLADLVTQGDGGVVVDQAFERCLNDPGTLVGDHLAALLEGRSGDQARAARRLLQSHISARVRRRAA